jgi:hypothetical protein
VTNDFFDQVANLECVSVFLIDENISTRHDRLRQMINQQFFMEGQFFESVDIQLHDPYIVDAIQQILARLRRFLGLLSQ